MDLNSLLPHLLYQFKNENDLLRAIEELSLKFTQDRENISDYLKDKRLTAAYTAFYLATNYAKWKSVIPWLPTAWVERFNHCSFIDVGAGPGTFSLAFRAWAEKAIPVLQIETSSVMQEQATKLWAGLYPGEELSKQVEGEKLLFFGHSANEMGVEAALKYIQRFSPEHILFVEPGTKDFFPKMIKIRSELLKEGYHIMYPCPTAESCPLESSNQDWCHQFINVRHDASVERLSQMVRKDRKVMPLIVHGFSRTLSEAIPSIRVVRVFPETKFSFEWEVCRLNTIYRYQIMKRGLSKIATRALENVLAGDSLEVIVEKEMEQSQRVKVLKINNSILES